MKDNRGVKVVRSVTINRPAAELFSFWRKLDNLPLFMSHLESLYVLGERLSHWVVKTPSGRTVDWDAEIINEEANELIVWRSCEGADIENTGSVRFQPAPGGRGTEVTVTLEYIPPAGILGRGVAWLFGEEPSQEVQDDLSRFKALMETGEIPVAHPPRVES